MAAERGLTLAFCWAHVRREFFGLAKGKGPAAEEALRRIASLYAVEGEVRGQPSDVRRAVRQERSRPLVEDLFAWLAEPLTRLVNGCAGFTPGEADLLRKSMATFKVAGGVSAFREKLVEGMVARGYECGFAERTFAQLEGFGSYGFPESHAASFALVAYASAWLKCWHPEVFCVALLNSQPMGFYAPAQIVRDAEEQGRRQRGA